MENKTILTEEEMIKHIVGSIDYQLNMLREITRKDWVTIVGTKDGWLNCNIYNFCDGINSGTNYEITRKVNGSKFAYRKDEK